MIITKQAGKRWHSYKEYTPPIRVLQLFSSIYNLIVMWNALSLYASLADNFMRILVAFAGFAIVRKHWGAYRWAGSMEAIRRTPLLHSWFWWKNLSRQRMFLLINAGLNSVFNSWVPQCNMRLLALGPLAKRTKAYDKYTQSKIGEEI